MSHLQNQKSCQPPFVLGKVTAKGGGRIDNPKYSRPSSSETNKGKGYKRENLVFFHTFCRKPRLNTFDICATAVMGIKRLAIQLDPVETSSRCCVYIRRETWYPVPSPFLARETSTLTVILLISFDSLNWIVLSTLRFSTGLYLEVEGRAKVAWNWNDNTYRAQHSYTWI
jgi:hypothetical protein